MRSPSHPTDDSSASLQPEGSTTHPSGQELVIGHQATPQTAFQQMQHYERSELTVSPGPSPAFLPLSATDAPSLVPPLSIAAAPHQSDYGLHLSTEADAVLGPHSRASDIDSPPGPHAFSKDDNFYVSSNMPSVSHDAPRWPPRTYSVPAFFVPASSVEATTHCGPVDGAAVGADVLTDSPPRADARTIGTALNSTAQPNLTSTETTGSKPTCQIQSCGADLSQFRAYCRRYRLCKSCIGRSSVIVEGREMRFCQQCSKMHPLSSFDGNKRSCREKLQRHMMRTRHMRSRAKEPQQGEPSDDDARLRSRPGPSQRPDTNRTSSNEPSAPPSSLDPSETEALGSDSGAPVVPDAATTMLMRILSAPP